jgi:uncharacterized protein (DUF305 family)
VVHAAPGRAPAAADRCPDLAGERITRPKLARLADTIDQQGQAHLTQIQE